MADCKRKTANLFNKSDVSEQGNFYIAAGNIIASASTTGSIQIPCKPNTTYTVKKDISARFTLFYTTEVPANGVDAYGVVNRPTQPYLTITTGENAAYLVVFLYHSSYDTLTYQQIIDSVVIVEGSAPPSSYIPYGWVHSLRKLGTATDTITTLPADLYADGNNATVGLVGNMQQTGTPTPSSPIYPTGTGNKTANLCSPTGWQQGQYSNGVWDTTTPNLLTSDFFEISEGEQYTITINSEKKLSFININYFDSSKTWLGNRATLGMAQFSTASQLETTPNMPSGSAYMKITVRPYNNVGDISLSDISTSDIMSNTGSTALPYEPYGIKIPISSANTTTPVYLGEVETTRKIKKLVLTGEETTWTKASSAKVFYLWQYDDDALNSANIISCMCSHYSAQGNVAAVSGVENLKCCFRTTAQTFYIHDDAFESNTDFVTYLQQQYSAGTPVTVWYVLATPTTGIVNEPLRKIGDYADTVSGITIPTIAGADSFDVLTTLKPSEVTVNYHGWHTGTVHERESGAWTE